MNPFKGRHFQRDIILWAVRWYCKYGISYRELQEMLAERGVNVDHSTIYRWVQRYAPEMEKRLRWYWRNPSDLCPWHMDADLYGYKWARDNVGQSGATIYRLYGKPDAPELFLKHGKGSVANDVTDEMVRLNWLTEFMPLPTIKHFIRTPDDAWLLTTAIPGKTAFQVLEEYPDSGENIVDALAVFLRRLHSIPVCNCPFNSDRVFRLAQAQSRMNNGLVDASDFDDERNGWPVEQVWKEMHKLLPFSPDSVVTHGDFSLDNLIFDEGKLIGCIDVGRVGIADRYQDLAILWNCLGEFSPSLQKRLFQKYGIDNPDMNKLQFHLMLDEFF